MGMQSKVTTICDWEVYALAVDGLNWVQDRWKMLGKPWKIASDVDLVRTVVAQAFQESAIDKKGPPYCGFDTAASAAPLSSALGLMQVLKGTWKYIQTDIVMMSQAEYRTLDDRLNPAWAMRLGMAYLVYCHDRWAVGNLRKALAHYHDGGIAKSAGYAYAKLILDKHLPKFNFPQMQAKYFTEMNNLPSLLEDRKEFP